MNHAVFAYFLILLGTLICIVALVLIHIKLRRASNCADSEMWHRHAEDWRETAEMYDTLAKQWEAKDRVKYREMLDARDKCIKNMGRCTRNSMLALMGKPAQGFE